MKAVAGFLSEDRARREAIGILHDIDFERVNGDMPQHGTMGAHLLKTAGIPDDTGEIVERPHHFLYPGTSDRPVEIALQAADSASGMEYCLCACQRRAYHGCPGEGLYQENKGEVLCCRVRPEPDRPDRAP